MGIAQNRYKERYDPARPKVHKVDLVTKSDGSLLLALQVNIEGRLHTLSLDPSDIPMTALKDQAVADELAKIRDHLSWLVDTQTTSMEAFEKLPGLNRLLSDVVKALGGIQAAIEQRPMK